MRQSQQEAQTPNALIAPGEIRELVARLTEQSVESVPPHEARTLEGLAAETGIPVARLRDELSQMRDRPKFAVPPMALAAVVFMAGYAYWLLQPRPVVESAPVTPVAVQPVVQQPDLAGLMPLTSVTYGPDSGSFQVDTTFEPTHPLPDGLSIYASVDTVLWGSGDHRAAVIAKPLSASQAEELRGTVVELLKYVREQAGRRRLAVSKALGGTNSGFQVNLGALSYYGAAGWPVSLPRPGVGDDKSAERAINRASKELVEQVQRSIRQQWEWKREMGP